ncbi:DUF58 domain-containing protein [Halalkalibacter sp. APA_J-10(15)]|uniref:DUF58 domain-containing protein n=1 Tax=Halalkalibacter sp. APA_J-10(15) TaxID=2933805 RepID=UPI001FF512C7|nr:DUF58 domain-containing protein [Halalkalibacter sp. APA_J-10(15)]MCK0473492.1 DUF58 domain-containing protein [Halalkalibacter sp. APA_J-10(15)]
MTRWMKVAFKYVFLIIIIGALFAYAMFQGGFVSWYLFYSVITIIVLMMVVTLFPFKVKQIRRIISEEAVEVGGTVDVTVKVEKYPFQPFFFVRIFDELPGRLQQEDTPGALFFFSFQRTLSFTYTISNLKRGVYRFGEVKCKFGDLFGLLEVERTLQGDETEILVYPSFHYLRSLPPVAQQREREGQRNRTSLQEDRSLAGVRQYVPGDRLASINWKQTARSSDLMSKEFESFQGEGALLVYDSFSKKSNQPMFEQSIELATSLLATLMRRQSYARFYIRKDRWESITVHQSMIPALQALAYVEPNRQPIEAIDGVYRKWSGTHIYYVCAVLDQALLAACRTLQAQRVTMTICTVALKGTDPRVVSELESIGVKVVEMS